MRQSYNDFGGGQIDKVEPYLLPDNACVEIKNYEITIAGSLQKRKEIESSQSLNTAFGSVSGVIQKVYIWYPSNKPIDADTGLTATKDEVYIVYSLENTTPAVGHLYLYYYTDGYIREEILAVPYTADSVIEGFAGSDRFLIADGGNRGHKIHINSDGEILSSVLGKKGTKYKPSITTIDTYKASYFEENSNKSYFDECGLVQIAIVFVDKYGNRSSPSPGSNVADFQYFKKDEDATATARWLKKFTAGNIRVPKGLTSDELDDLVDIEIYARVHRFSEGAESSVYTLCKTVHIGSKAYNENGIPSPNSYTITLHNPDAREIEYVSYQAPICKHITEVANVIFTGNLKERESDLFPYEFDNVCKIELDNVNAQTYINGLVRLRLHDENYPNLEDGEFISNLNWGVYLGLGNFELFKNHIRIYDVDRKTALRVAYLTPSNSDHYLDVIIQIPKILSSVNVIYFCFKISGWTNPAVTDTEFQTYEYGKFIDINSSDLLDQNMFQTIKVPNVDCSICSPMKEINERIINTADDATSLVIGDDTIGITTGNTNFMFFLPNYSLFRNTKYFQIGSALDYARYSYERLLPEKGILFFRMRNLAEFFTTDNRPIVVFLRISGTDRYFGLKAIAVPALDEIRYYLYNSGVDVNYTEFSTANGLTQLIIAFSWDISGEDEEHKFSFFAIDNANPLETHGIEFSDEGLCADAIFKTEEMEYLCFGYPDTGEPMYAYYSQILLIENEFWENDSDGYNKKRFRNIANAMPDYGTMFLGYDYTDHNVNIFFNETEELGTKDRTNWAQWSDINGTNFNSGYLRKLKDEITAIVPFKTSLADAIYPSVAYFTPSTLVRMVLQGTNAGLWVDNTQSMFEEYFGFGLYAVNSIARRGDDIIWFSPEGVMRIGVGGLQNLQEMELNGKLVKIIDIPLDSTYIGIYIPLRDQYFLHTQGLSVPLRTKTYVYDFLHKAWVTFTGLDIDFAQFYQRGSRKNLFLDSDRNINLYPSDDNYDGDDLSIKTKQYKFDNPFYERFKLDFDGECDVTITVKNPDATVTKTFETIGRMKLRGLSLAAWGEYIQFLIKKADKFKRVDFDVINR